MSTRSIDVEDLVLDVEDTSNEDLVLLEDFVCEVHDIEDLVLVIEDLVLGVVDTVFEAF